MFGHWPNLARNGSKGQILGQRRGSASGQGFGRGARAPACGGWPSGGQSRRPPGQTPCWSGGTCGCSGGGTQQVAAGRRRQAGGAPLVFPLTVGTWRGLATSWDNGNGQSSKAAGQPPAGQILSGAGQTWPGPAWRRGLSGQGWPNVATKMETLPVVVGPGHPKEAGRRVCTKGELRSDTNCWRVVKRAKAV